MTHSPRTSAHFQDPQVFRDLQADPLGALDAILRAIEDTTFQDSRKAIYRLDMIRQLAIMGRYIAQQVDRAGGVQ